MPDLKPLVAAVHDSDSLCDLLRALDWPVLEEFPFDDQPEIAQGVKGAKCMVRSLIPASSDDPRLFLLVEFQEPYARRDLRQVLSSLRRYTRNTAKWHGKTGTGDTIFVVASPRYEEVRFVLFEEQEGRQPKLRSFEWERNAIGRTLLEYNLERLRWADRDQWQKAWDVEKLTKDFFSAISTLFFDTVEALEQKLPEENERRLYVQTLFNRLIFLRFVEKKAWLRFPFAPVVGVERAREAKESRPDYLRALWEAGQSGPHPFWPTRLNRLFNAVNHPLGDNSHISAVDLIGEVPYLNGGLFEENLFKSEQVVAAVPTRIFKELLGEDGLFYRYNFTVEESSPLDVQVAVDPEILGKIFEQLTISGKRHDTGSYYTPREIVQFMCREALVGYLGDKVIGEEKARNLVYDHDDSTLTNHDGDQAFRALREIKVVDPACGSGAYLLGMLQELYALFEKLYRDDRKFSLVPAEEAHARKLQIIENNIYGVDLQAFATNTAMLRLWLTLLVEDTGKKPQPLPNLEYKIETGDSLLGPNPSQPIDWSKVQRGLDFEGREETVEELRNLRARYQESHKNKAQVKAQFEAKLAELREKVTGNPRKDPTKFDWRVEFFDVFLDDPNTRPPGFDAVLANPPYVRHELITAIKPELRRVFGAFYCGTADLYTYFYARAHQLLRPDGMLAFISSDKWFRAAYGANLRKLMAEQTCVRSITDFGELPVFLTAATFPMIFVTQKSREIVNRQSPIVNPIFTQVKTLDPPYPDVAALIAQSGFPLPPNALNGAEWRLVDAETAARMRRMEASGVPLGEYVKGKIYYGIKTGFNEAFVIDGAKRAALIAEDPSSAEIIKPLAVGDDVRRWRIRKRDVWLIFTRRGVDLDRHPAIKQHLMQWRTELEPRPRDWKPSKPGEVWQGRKPGSYKWYEIQDDIAYYAEFDKPKILYPVIGKEPRFAYDQEGAFTNDKTFLIPTEALFLPGVLNSAPAWDYLKNLCSALGDSEDGGRLELRSVYMETLPVPRASAADCAAIESVVQQILRLKSADPAADASTLEAEIDARVEFLYFHADEAPTYDAWLAKKEAEKGTAVEEIRKLVAGGENAKVEFKETLEAGGTNPEHKAAVFTASLRAICSLINKDGGTLLIGVHDTNGIIGLQRDGATDAPGRDRFLQKIAGGLKSRAINYSPNLIDVRFADVDGKWVAKVDIKPTKGAKVLLDGKLYVRDLTTTVELDPTTMAYMANVETDESA